VPWPKPKNRTSAFSVYSRLRLEQSKLRSGCRSAGARAFHRRGPAAEKRLHVYVC